MHSFILLQNKSCILNSHANINRLIFYKFFIFFKERLKKKVFEDLFEVFYKLFIEYYNF